MKIINTSHLFDINKKINSLEKCMHFTAAVNKSLTSIIIPHFQEVPNSKKMGKKNTFLSLFLEMNCPLGWNIGPLQVIPEQFIRCD